MLNATTCDIHTFDCTTDGTSQHPSRHFFHKWCVGASSSREDFRTWTNITTTLGHPLVHLLKVDIETSEFAVLSQFKPQDALPSEISVEFHVGWSLPAHQQNSPNSTAELALVFLHMARLGYAAYSQEVNPIDPRCCCEFSFLRLKGH